MGRTVFYRAVWPLSMRNMGCLNILSGFQQGQNFSLIWKSICVAQIVFVWRKPKIPEGCTHKPPQFRLNIFNLHFLTHVLAVFSIFISICIFTAGGFLKALCVICCLLNSSANDMWASNYHIKTEMVPSCHHQKTSQRNAQFCA